jgi:HPt (histidine-containing phosphotransfer) domain-containing protein
LFEILIALFENLIPNTNMDYKFINMEYLDSVAGGDASIINEIVAMFKEQSVEIYNEMNSLLEAKNYTSLGLLAHKAKSSVAIMGMQDLADMLKTFELQAKEGKEPELYKSYTDRFKNDTKEAIKELDDLISYRLNGK